MDDEIKHRVSQHDKAIFGDRDNPTDTPGIIHELKEIKEFVAFNRKLHWFVVVSVAGLLIKSLGQIVIELIQHLPK